MNERPTCERNEEDEKENPGVYLYDAYEGGDAETMFVDGQTK